MFRDTWPSCEMFGAGAQARVPAVGSWTQGISGGRGEKKELYRLRSAYDTRADGGQNLPVARTDFAGYEFHPKKGDRTTHYTVRRP